MVAVAVEGDQVAPVVVGRVLVDVGAVAVVVAAGARERGRTASTQTSSLTPSIAATLTCSRTV